jgi:predicted outer membrane protein
MKVNSRGSSVIDTLKSILACNLAVACLLVPSWPARAANPTKASPADRRFVLQLSEAIRLEERFGQLIEKQSKNSDVKQLGQKLVEDYAQAVQRLDTLAQSLGVVLAPKSAESGPRAYDKLAALSGPAFDRAVLDQIITYQETSMRALEDISKHADCPELRDLGSSLLSDLDDDVYQTRLLFSEFKRVA